MILYLDTSALLKLFLTESSSEFVSEMVEKAKALAVSRIGYVECFSALARRRRQSRLTEAEYTAAAGELSKRWPEIVSVELDEFAAAELARRHGLRALDALHLAAASKVRSGGGEISILFCTFDARQAAAAEAEKFQVVPHS